MEAFALIRRNEAKIIDLPSPKLSDPYNAILTPVAISVCTSDVNTVYGSGSKKPDNLILGHEAVARIVKVGEKVKDFKEGDVVVVPSMTPNFHDKDIQDGNFLHAGANFSANTLGRSTPGVFAREFEVADADLNLAILPEGVSLGNGLMCTDMATTGFTGAERVNFGDTVVVLGIGGVGLMAVCGAALRGAGRIIAVGSRGASVPLAYEYGASEVISYKNDDITEYVLKATNGKGADVVIIAGGNDKSFSDAIDMVRYGVGKVVNLKLFTGDGSMEIPKFSSGRGMSGKSVYMELGKGGRVRMERLLSMVKNKRFTPEKLITHTFEGFENVEQALELMRDKGNTVIKTMILTGW
ncbi:alcohol dehydrogenase, catalytic domain protein, GroES-like family [Lachnoanaerobaculum sp. ICM7]|jgi:alcohol dehydrogenase zinc-binding domain protein|uniref:zinc-binding dehydrogenase n=1 Tax=Lachnoanaerobaculum sp. ICM7 TaxID=936594 RepID=UPI00027A675E|nr:zinc-binding dehydrogenase [Lachnoanaerobaculum sp. ICM7]EJP19872.1 alcohol dehydrogenase, catalytic domain protein, GroES-like family [Lachnoanaerobaculum sp. ICM7]